MTTPYVRPFLTPEADWAAANPEAARGLPYAASYIPQGSGQPPSAGTTTPAPAIPPQPK